ncbi:MAG: hypothetical protein ABIK82_21775 [Pseudomonadota bacterium]
MFSSRLISRWLLLIVTLTILSPRFAWDVMAAEDHHTQVLGVLTVHDVLDHDHDVDHSGAEHADHHSGDGYLFTHLPAQISASPLPLPALADDGFEPAIAPVHTSHDPERLERPPRHRSA